MTAQPDGTLKDTSLFQDFVAPRLNALHFALLEKRGIPLLRFSGNMNQQAKISAFREAGEHCAPDYLANATKQSRVEDVVATTRALTREPWARQLILVGHSEGTHVVTGVLRVTNPSEVAAAALFASAGPIPFFGGYVARGAGDRAQFESTFDEIRMLQRQDDDFVYQGLPVRRWKTFWLDSTPVDDVRATIIRFLSRKARVMDRRCPRISSRSKRSVSNRDDRSDMWSLTREITNSRHPTVTLTSPTCWMTSFAGLSMTTERQGSASSSSEASRNPIVFCPSM